MDRDNDNRAWDIYEIVYDDDIDKEKREIIYQGNSTAIKASGDVCFNVKLKYGKRYTLLGSILKDDQDLITKLEPLLQELLYSPMNMSLLPKTGGLNNIKKHYGNDRFDSFIYLIDQYYKGVTAPIINRGTTNSYIKNQMLLADFLNSFNNVFE